MKFKDGSAVLILMGVVLSALLAMPVPALSDDQDRIRSWRDGGDHLDDPMIQLRLRGQIIDDTGLTESELEIYMPLIEEALSLNGGDSEQIRNMFRKAVGEDCVGDCLMKRLRIWKRTMIEEQERFVDLDEAEVREKTREQTRSRTGEQDGEPDGTQTQEQTREHSQEQTQNQAGDQSGDQNQNRSGSGGGGRGK